MTLSEAFAAYTARLHRDTVRPFLRWQVRGAANTNTGYSPWAGHLAGASVPAPFFQNTPPRALPSGGVRGDAPADLRVSPSSFMADPSAHNDGASA